MNQNTHQERSKNNMELIQTHHGQQKKTMKPPLYTTIWKY